VLSLGEAVARHDPPPGSAGVRTGARRTAIWALGEPLYTCEAVLTEAAHFLGNPELVLAAVADVLLVRPWDLCEHYARVRELARKYGDQPIDLADACLVAMSEKWWDCKVVTVDATDFKIYRRRGRHAIPLLTPQAS
jgi:uncharacterized protein